MNTIFIYVFTSIGFGKFHYYLLFICGSLYTAVAFSFTSVSFIIPSAQCDFKMTSTHKGLLNGAMIFGKPFVHLIIYLLINCFKHDVSFFFLGMLMGSFIWGYVADSRGRKFTLVVSMMIDGLFNLLSSVAQVYPMFILCRLLSGFGWVNKILSIYSYSITIEKTFYLFCEDKLVIMICRVSSVSVLFSYLVEFLNTKYREKFLTWMEMFWTNGLILLPCKYYTLN